MYENGLGVKQNFVEALQWFEKSAERGNTTAQLNLGMMYKKGLGVKQNFEKAFQWFEKSAKGGNTIAQLNLGVMYEKGLVVEKNVKKAFYWYQESAGQGNMKAQYNLGLIFYRGLGVEKNFEKAFQWFEKGAEQGLRDAQFNVGIMYENGLGVEKNIEQALYWYKKSVKQGYERAFNGLFDVAIGKSSGNTEDRLQAQTALAEVYMTAPKEHVIKYYNKAIKENCPFACIAAGVLSSQGKLKCSVNTNQLFEKADTLKQYATSDVYGGLIEYLKGVVESDTYAESIRSDARLILAVAYSKKLFGLVEDDFIQKIRPEVVAEQDQPSQESSQLPQVEQPVECRRTSFGYGSFFTFGKQPNLSRASNDECALLLASLQG